MVNLIRCPIPEGCTCLFCICLNSKVCCLNLDADQVSFVFQVGAALIVEIKHIIQTNGELYPESLRYLVQPNC